MLTKNSPMQTRRLAANRHVRRGYTYRSCRRGLGLIELLTLVAVLMIALAMMVATARHVRSTSANELTRKRMRALADAAVTAMARGEDPTLATPTTGPGEPPAHAPRKGETARDRSPRRRAVSLDGVKRGY